MTRKGFLSACLGLVTANAVATAQVPPPAAPPQAGNPSAAPAVRPEPMPAGTMPVADGQPVAQPTPLVCAECNAGGHDFWTRPTLTGDWLGVRPRLKDRGITFDADLTQFAFGIGGGVFRPVLPVFSPGDTFEYTGRGDYSLTFDLDKFGGMPYGKLLVRAQHWWGNYGNVSLNTGALPPAIFAASLPPTPNDPGMPYITDFILTQPLSKEWVVFAGKKNVIGAADQDDFAGGNGTNQFLNQALIANPAFLLALPYTSFTAGVVSPREWGGFSAFIYDPQDRTKDFFRLDDLFSTGIIVGTEVKLKTNFFSLPGEHHVGGLWKHLEMTDLRFNEPPPGVYPERPVPGFPTLGDSYTIYYGFDQYIQTFCENPKRGWGFFGRASISDGNPTPVRYFLSGGIGGYSPIRRHRGDTFGIGYYYAGASTQFGPLPRAVLGPRDGQGVELYYNFQVTPWMNLTPDFQIVKPESGAIADTAYIGGIRLNIKL